MIKPFHWGVFTLLLVTALIFTGCQGSTGEPSETTAEAAEPEELVITSGGVTDFYVIRGDMANSRETQLAVKVRKTIAEKTGAEPGITTDWEKNPVYEHEIIVGNTLRETSGLIDRIALGETGYVVKEIDGKIFIAGGSDAGTELGVNYFLDTYIKGGECSIPKGESIIVYHQYDIPNFYIDMKKLDKSSVIAVSSELKDNKQLIQIVEMLRSILYDKTGLYLDIITGEGKGFVISSEKPTDEGMHEITVEDGSLVFRSSASLGVGDCVKLFAENYLADVFGDYNFPSDFRYYDLGDYIIVSYPAENNGGK